MHLLAGGIIELWACRCVWDMGRWAANMSCLTLDVWEVLLGWVNDGRDMWGDSSIVITYNQ